MSTDIFLEHLPVFDRADLVERMGGYEEGLDQFLLEFPAYLAEGVTELRTALEVHDLENVLGITHKIKGMCGNASVERCREVACRMETAAKQGNIDEAQSLFTLLEQEEKNLCEYLAQKNKILP
jgi:HPt (histidine-containing phosphotransfer) domain-containing protein